MKRSLLILPSVFLFLACMSVGQTIAPGGPGNDAYWATAAKQGIGTSASLESKVWFTLADGVMTEVYYPDVTTANVHMLQFVVVNPKTKKVETERDDANHEVRVLRPASLTFQQVNTAKSGEWKITKTYVTDPLTSSVLINVEFVAKTSDFNLYVYFDPSLANRGMGDQAGFKYALDDDVGFLHAEKPASHVATVLAFTSPLSEQTSGFYGVNDGLAQLKENRKIEHRFDIARNGNVAQMARIMQPHQFTVAVGFGKSEPEAWGNSSRSNGRGFAKVRAEYEKGWSDFVKTLPKVDPKYQAQFNVAAMVLKAQEDKTVRGANVASLTIPWGGGKNANTDVGGGYHLVWARDLYEVFTAYMALGDKAAANRALDFLFNIQQKPDGSFPQNSWLDGRNGWGGLQMDEVGYPLIMAWQLSRFDKQTYEKHVKPAADFIVSHGPTTPQERWEEKGGYSPSTIAAEIAGLVCAADIAKRNGDGSSADIYLRTADEWQANIEKWTATTNGPYGDGHYYLRLTQGHPDAGEKIELNNGAGVFKENEIVDAGFLELVRLGIKPADDPLIARSVKVVDEKLKVDTPNGPGFYRYSHDGYGEMDDGRRWNWDGKYTGKGRLWALLSGERGQYELANCGTSEKGSPAKSQSRKEGEVRAAATVSAINQQCVSSARSRLDAMLGFANEGLMIPEQVWDKKEVPANRDREFVPELKFGEGTGSATPLAWSMAQFIRLAMNLKAGKNLDTPQVVYDRYVLQKISADDVTINTGEPQQLPTPKNTKNLLNLKPGAVPDTESSGLQEIPLDCSLNYRVMSLFKLTDVPETSPKDFRPSSVPDISKKGATFFYRGSGKNVEVVGDFSGWKPGSFKLSDVMDTKWKCVDAQFAPTARVEYKLIVDGKWITDPLNPNKIDNGVGGENSVLTMPDYKPTEWAKGDKFAGKLEPLKVASKVWNETRRVQVYTPPLPEKVQQSLKRANPIYPVLYLQDGSDYIARARAIQVQENLVKAGKVRPFIMVFIDYRDRTKEYWASDNYAKFISEEIVPLIDDKYRTERTADGRAILGASLGGVTSFWTALKYPDVFARVGGQSSSFWIDDQRVIKELAKLDASKTKLKFYLDDGTLEGTANSRKVADLLRGKGYDVSYTEAEAGHNWTAWRDRLADAFIALWK